MKNIELRKKDIIIRISDWTKDKDEPAIDVEVYYNQEFNPTLSKIFSSKDKVLRRYQISKHVEEIAYNLT